MSEEEENCEPEFLTVLLDIMDINEKELKKSKPKGSAALLKKYKQLKTDYDLHETEILDKIREFNTISSAMEEQLFGLSAEFIALTGQSPGEWDALAQQKKEFAEIVADYKVNGQPSEAISKKMRVLRKMFKENDPKKTPVNLETLSKITDRLAKLEEAMQSAN